jgi:hypothetical protein
LCSGLVLRYPDVFVDFLLFVELSEQGAQSVAGASTRPIGSGGRETRCTTWRASRARHANASCRPGRNLPCTSTKSSARPTTWRRLTEGTAPTTVRRSQYSGQLLSLGEMISAFFPPYSQLLKLLPMKFLTAYWYPKKCKTMPMNEKPFVTEKSHLYCPTTLILFPL